MSRQMGNAAFLADQRVRLHEPHIAPITDYIDALRASSGRWLPYVAPLHGGVNARVLNVLRDPGPKTQELGGSGMICIENDDQTAAAMYELMEQAGMTPADLTPWNAYPWYINRSPSDEEIAEASPTLTGLIDLMPNLEIVLLQGRDAQAAWKVALAAQPALRRRRLEVFETYHPSVQALHVKSVEERERRVQHRIDTWQQVGEWLRG